MVSLFLVMIIKILADKKNNEDKLFKYKPNIKSRNSFYDRIITRDIDVV